MKSSTTESFWRAYNSLPPEIKNEARKAYQENPRHPVVDLTSINAFIVAEKNS